MSDRAPFARLIDAWPWLQRRTTLVKAISFGLIGVINAAVDTVVFFLARAVMMASAGAVTSAAGLAAWCACAEPQTPILVTANIMSWLVAVSGSYVMNTSITFAAESGRTLRLKDYLRFAASGVAGLLANTTTLVVTDDFLPLIAAKGAAILVGFVVNFSLSHFVVFRVRSDAG